MKTMYRVIILSIIIISLAVTIYLYLQTKQPNNNIPNPSTTFNFIFRWGQNELNTFEDTFTKDMVIDEPLTTKFQLSNSEMVDISRNIISLKIFETNTKPVPEKIQIGMTPCTDYYLKTETNSLIQETSWSDCYGRIDDKFKQFDNFIIPLIESKDEYKALPPARAGRL